MNSSSRLFLSTETSIVKLPRDLAERLGINTSITCFEIKFPFSVLVGVRPSGKSKVILIF